MAQPIPSSRRLCPTRPDGAHSLIAQTITPNVCLDRQRALYHKCFACQYRGLAADVILPTPHRDEELPEVVVAPPVPVARKKVSKAM